MTKPILCFLLTISLIIFLGDSRSDGSNVSQPRLTAACIYAGMAIVAIVAISFLVVLLCRRRNSHPGMEHSDEVRIEVGHGQLSYFVCAFTSRTRKRSLQRTPSNTTKSTSTSGGEGTGLVVETIVVWCSNVIFFCSFLWFLFLKELAFSFDLYFLFLKELSSFFFWRERTRFLEMFWWF